MLWQPGRITNQFTEVDIVQSQAVAYVVLIGTCHRFWMTLNGLYNIIRALDPNHPSGTNVTRRVFSLFCLNIGECLNDGISEQAYKIFMFIGFVIPQGWKKPRFFQKKFLGLKGFFRFQCTNKTRQEEHPIHNSLSFRAFSVKYYNKTHKSQ